MKKFKGRPSASLTAFGLVFLPHLIRPIRRPSPFQPTISMPCGMPSGRSRRAYGDPATTQIALVSRLRVGPVGVRPAFPYAQRHRRLQLELPGLHRRHLAVGSLGRSRVKLHRRASRAALHSGERQRYRSYQSCRARVVPRYGGASGTTSHRARYNRTASLRALMVACAANVRTSTCSHRGLQRDGSSRHGGWTKIPRVRTAALAESHSPSLQTAPLGGVDTESKLLAA